MKKKVIKKVLAALLVTAMFTTACGSTDAPASSEKSSEASAESSKPASSEAAEVETKEYWQMLGEVSDTSELPDWTGDKLEITVWYAHGTGGAAIGDIPETDVCFEEFERVTGVSFNVEESYDNAGESQDAKLPKIIASKDYPTIMVGGEQSMVDELAENGYLVDLTEYWGTEDLYGFDYWLPAEVGKDNSYQNVVSEDGKVYWLPAQQYNPNVYSIVDYAPAEYDSEYWRTYGSKPAIFGGANYMSSNAVWVRDDILKAVRPEALTMAEITDIYVNEGTFTKEQIFDVGLESVDDMYQLFRDIKAEIDTGNYVGLDGKKLEVTYGPNTETDNWDITTMAAPWLLGFGANCDSFTINVLDDDPSTPLIQKTWENETYVEYLRNLNALVNEDIISQTSFVDNSTTFKEKGANGHYAVSYGNGAWNGIPSAETLEAAGVDYGYRPVYINQEFSGIGGLSNGGNGMIIASGIAIFKDTLSDEQVEQLVHAFSYLASPVGANNFLWGPATAGLFTEDADGNRTYTDDELYANMILREDNEAAYKYGIQFGQCTTRTLFNIGLTAMFPGYKLLNPQYLAYGSMDRVPSDARYYYNPGIFEEYAFSSNYVLVNQNPISYSFGANNVEGIKEWWASRAGFEKQLTKAIAASVENFDKELAEVDAFCDSTGFTDEALQEFNEKYIEAEKEKLDAAGIVY